MGTRVVLEEIGAPYELIPTTIAMDEPRPPEQLALNPNGWRRFILRVTSTSRATIAIAIGTIPVDPSDDAGDGGGTSKRVSPDSRTTDPNSHTPVGFRLAAVHRTDHLQSKEKLSPPPWICG